MMNDDPVEVSGELLRATDSAYLISDGSTEVWIPRSICEFEPDRPRGVVGVFTMPYWKAAKEGLI